MANSTNELSRRREEAADPDAIRTEIAQTRAEMEHTIDEIQARLSPARLKQQTQATIREATIGKVEDMTHRAEREVKNWRAKIVHTVKENPVPAALVGVGLGWLIMADSGHGYYPEETERYYPTPYRSRYVERPETTGQEIRDRVEEGRERLSEAAQEAKDRTQTAVSNIQDRARDVAESVQESAETARHQVRQTVHETRHRAEETAEHLQTSVQQGMRRTKRTFRDTMDENPLAVGVAAVAAGALVGLALPSTAAENNWLGERRDALVEEAKERVQHRAKETAQKVQAVVTEAKDAAVETAKEEADKEGLRPASSNEQ